MKSGEIIREWGLFEGVFYSNLYSIYNTGQKLLLWIFSTDTNDFELHHGTTNSRGTAIFFSNLGYDKLFYFSDNNGRLQILSLKLKENGKKLLIVNIYNPNTKNLQVSLLKLLIEKLDTVSNIEDHEVIMGGDWNCVLNRDLDCIGGNHGTKINTLAEISKIRSKYDHIDIFRTKHPNFRRYTCCLLYTSPSPRD